MEKLNFSQKMIWSVLQNDGCIIKIPKNMQIVLSSGGHGKGFYIDVALAMLRGSSRELIANAMAASCLPYAGVDGIIGLHSTGILMATALQHTNELGHLPLVISNPKNENPNDFTGAREAPMTGGRYIIVDEIMSTVDGNAYRLAQDLLLEYGAFTVAIVVVVNRSVDKPDSVKISDGAISYDCKIISGIEMDIPTTNKKEVLSGECPFCKSGDIIVLNEGVKLMVKAERLKFKDGEKDLQFDIRHVPEHLIIRPECIPEYLANLK